MRKMLLRRLDLSMPKSKHWAYALVCIAIASSALLSFLGCAGSSSNAKVAKVEHRQPAPPMPQGEADPSAPGMIPGECEALLNKSQEWKYVPGQAWRPASPEQMLEVARFFSSYRLIPPHSSEFFRQIREPARPSQLEAEKIMQQFGQAQVCDLFIAQSFLSSLLDYRWPLAMKAEANSTILRFLLNQQSLQLPLLHRALAARIFVKAAERGFLPGLGAKAREFKGWLEKEMSQAPAASEGAAPLVSLNAIRREFAASEEIRERLARLLPLP